VPALERWVYSFGDGRADGSAAMRDILGGKWAGLAEMANLGLPVPPGFTISAKLCIAYLEQGTFPDDLREEVDRQLKQLERASKKRFGDARDPLLVSVRSGAAVSMPGMMETILNLGLNDETVQGLIEGSKNPRFAYDSYRRFVQMYGDVVFDLGKEPFTEVLAEFKRRRKAQRDIDLPADDLKALAREFKSIIQSKTGLPFPEDPTVQLWGAIAAVFKSWRTRRAVDYRRVHGIPDDLGTAVNVVAMVYGNMGDDSGTGVVPHVAVDHRDHVHRGTQIVGDAVHPAVIHGPARAPALEDRRDRPPQLDRGILGEGKSRLRLDNGLELARQGFQVVGGEVDVPLRLAAALELVQHLGERLLAEIEHHVAVHLDEAAVGIVGEPRVLRALDEALHGLVVQAQVENGLHHAGHRHRGARAHRDEQRITRVAESLLGRALQLLQLAIDFLSEIIGEGAVFEVGDAELGGDGEPWGDGKAQVRHFGEAGPLATQDVAHRRGAVGAAVAERIHPPLERRHGRSTGDGSEERGGVAGPLEILGDIGRVIAREAGVTEVGRIAAGGSQHAVQREIAERVHAEVIADLCDAVARPDQFVPAGRVDPVIARPGDGRRSDAEMHLGRTRLADQLNQRPAGRATDDRVVHHHDLLSLKHFRDGIELDLDLRHAAGLGGMDERAADVVIADERVLELDSRLLGEPECHGVRGVRHREDAVRAR